MGTCCGGEKKKESFCCEIDPSLQVRIDRWLRGIAGMMILFSLLLVHFHSQNWIWFTAFIGVNLLQSAFTKWCPAMSILKKIFS